MKKRPLSAKSKRQAKPTTKSIAALWTRYRSTYPERIDEPEKKMNARLLERRDAEALLLEAGVPPLEVTRAGVRATYEQAGVDVPKELLAKWAAEKSPKGKRA